MDKERLEKIDNRLSERIREDKDNFYWIKAQRDYNTKFADLENKLEKELKAELHELLGVFHDYLLIENCFAYELGKEDSIKGIPLD